MQSKKLKILLAGGGTAGHIFPLAAVVPALQKQALAAGFEPDIRYFGNPGTYRYALERLNVRIARITSSKFRRYASLANLLTPVTFLLGFIESLWKVFWFMPNVAFSKGGPGSLPIIFACRFYTIPYALHESDAVPGLTTAVAARGAAIVELAFAEASRYFKNKKTNVVGTPVRPEVLVGLNESGANIAAKMTYGFDPEIATILIIGGSQGTQSFNDFVINNLAELTEQFQILHQVGLQNFEQYQAEYEAVSPRLPEHVKTRYQFKPFFTSDIAEAYHASDLVLARASGNVIFEAAAHARPMLLVPLPGSANGHQEANAHAIEQLGAAVEIEQENFLPHIVMRELKRILTNADIYRKMSAAAKAIHEQDAAKSIASDILELVIRGI